MSSSTTVNNMDKQIAKTTQSLTTAAEVRETTKMLMKPNANWEEYLTPAPLSIAIMGELVFISHCDDFSINKNPPKGGYKFIKYPDSFRACLMQVCNSGWHAFNEAHKNMDQIRIHTSTVPDYMKTAVNILFNSTDKIIEALLPNQLENIRTIADECVILADSVEKKYTDVINLIQELLEACINAEHFYGEEMEKVKMKLEENKLREQSARQLSEQSKKAMEAMSKQMEEAQDAYKKAMDSLPSGWEMIGMDVVESLSSGMTAIMNGCVSRMADPIGASALMRTFRDGAVGKNVGENVDEFAPMTAYSKSAEILKVAGSLKQLVSGSEIDWEDLYDQKNKSVKTEWTEEQFKRISEDLEEMSGDVCKKALSLCKRGITICEELATYTPDQTWDEEKTKQLIKDIKKLNDRALTFDTKSKAASGTPALTAKPPMMSKADNSSGGKSAGQRASENARFSIEQSQAQLSQVRQSYEKSVENMEKNQKELTDILVEMQNCKLNEIDFDTKIKMLVKGLDAMGRVKEQWEKMVRFFQMVSNIVKISLSKTMHNFIKAADDIKMFSYNEKLFVKDLLYKQAFEASNIASLIHMISETYTEVSNKYLMDRVSSLGKLMAMDKERPEFLHERLKLQESCDDAQRGILQLVLKNKKEFERQTDARMKKIEGDLKAILPAAPPEETERIKEIVQAGFSKEEEDYY
ncbi:uncharacterized protein LOC108874522 isoform X2 [Lates calcarifer]|uniref:Uncharacterized protein LOC108874522 isoform X2 n=1 Tax=Lates calcarifer TaxID=8187 RepID=A0AAJ8B360_LATCA|nr:uncharacterized protein LOC108874522 isoform X2 [Lates calcarifer]